MAGSSPFCLHAPIVDPLTSVVKSLDLTADVVMAASQVSPAEAKPGDTVQIIANLYNAGDLTARLPSTPTRLARRRPMPSQLFPLIRSGAMKAGR